MALARWIRGGAWAAAIGGCALACGSAPADVQGSSTSGGDDAQSSDSTAATTSTTGTTSTTSTTSTTQDASESSDTTTLGDEATSDPLVCDDSSGAFGLDDDEGGSSGSSAEDTNGGMGGDIPIGATVFAVREGGYDAGTLVEIEEIVVIAPVVDSGNYALVFVQAEIGGEYSGIVLASASPVTNVDIGTRVRVVGRVATLGELTRIVVDGDVEVIVPQGDAEVPAPIVLELATLSDPTADLLAYDAALVRIELPEVTDDPACPGEFSLAAALRVDDLFLGDDAPSPAAGSMFSAILGPLRQTSTGYEIAPRSLDDLIE